MSTGARVGAVSFRPLRDDDLPMLHHWLGRPHVREWWGEGETGPTLREVMSDYAPDALAAERVMPLVVLLDGAPVGYAQAYVAMGSGGGWWDDVRDPGVRGIDVFLAHAELLNRGLGTRVIEALAAQLFADPAVTMLQADPAPDNARAIRCYEKAGFVAQGRIVTPDGEAVYLTRARPG